MITDPAKFTLDVIDHMRTMSDIARANHVDSLMPKICEFDVETSSRIVFNLFHHYDLSLQPNSSNCLLFHTHCGKFIIENCIQRSRYEHNHDKNRLVKTYDDETEYGMPRYDPLPPIEEDSEYQRLNAWKKLYIKDEANAK